MKSFEDIIDEIIANMDKQGERARIKAFVTDISMMLRENGVIPCMSEVSAEIDDDDALKTVFCCQLEKLDFTEHDKVFKNEIAGLKAKIAIKDMDYKTVSELLGKYQQENEALKKRIIELEDFSCQAEQETESLVEKLKQRIAELESKETNDLPFDPLECANYLINATYERETSSLERIIAKTPDKVNSDRYTIDDLEQIAEHLLVYCKHNKESEE